MSATTQLVRTAGEIDNARPLPGTPAADQGEGMQPFVAPTMAADDPDALDLAAAIAASKAEDESGATAPAAPAAPAAAAATPEPAAATAAAKPGPVPYDRFAAVATQARTATEQAAYWKGVAEARGIKPDQPVATPEPAAPTADDRKAIGGRMIADAEKHIRTAGEQFDQGEAKFADFLEAQFAGLGRVMDVREQLLIETLTAAVTKLVNDTVGQAIATYQGAADRMVLAQQLTTLKAQHPYLAVMSDKQLGTLAEMAKTEAAAAGKPIGGTQADTLRLRQHVANLTDLFGPRWHPNHTPAATAAQPASATSQPAQPTRPALPAPGPAAVVRKAALAAAQPPSGSTATGAVDRNVTTEADIDALSDDEIEALPAAVRQRVLAG